MRDLVIFRDKQYFQTQAEGFALWFTTKVKVSLLNFLFFKAIFPCPFFIPLISHMSLQYHFFRGQKVKKFPTKLIFNNTGGKAPRQKTKYKTAFSICGPLTGMNMARWQIARFHAACQLLLQGTKKKMVVGVVC